MEPGDCRLTTSPDAARAYRAGKVAQALALDPTFALAHAAVALLGHEHGLPVDVCARLHCAELHARRSTEAERHQVAAVARRIRSGDRQAVPGHGDRLLRQR